MKTKLFLILVLLFSVFLLGFSTYVEAAKPTGTLVVGLASFGGENFLVPYVNQDAFRVVQSSGYLIRRRPDSSLEPDLATQWKLSGNTWTFDLRKGVPFHDGWGEFTAEDVKFSFELAIREGSQNWVAGEWRRLVKKVEIVNPYRIVFHLSNPDWAFLYRMTNVQPFLPINCKKYVQTVGEKVAAAHPISTGPFRFVEHKLGNYIKFEAVENHYRQTPYIKTLILKLVPDEASRVAMLKAGEIDFASISYDTLKEVEAAGFKVFTPLAAGLYVMMIGQFLPTEPGYDPTVPWALPDRERALKVRRALAMAINRQEIIDTLFAGKGEILKSVICWSEHEVYREVEHDLKPIPYDPQGAKKLLAEAGYPNGFACAMAMSTQPSRPINTPACEAVAMYWEKNLGLKVKRENPDWTTMKGMVTARKVSGWAHVFPVLYYDSPLINPQNVSHSGVSLMWGNVTHEQDALIDKGMAEMDPVKRRAFEREITLLYDREIIWIPIARVAALVAANPKVKDWKSFIGYPVPEQYFEYMELDIKK